MRHLKLSLIVAAATFAFPVAAQAGSNAVVNASASHTSMPVQSYVPTELSNDLNTNHLLKRAIINYKEGNTDTAAMLLHRTLRTDGSNPVANYYMGLTKKKQGSMRTALKHLKIANAVFANAPQSYAALGEVYVELGRIDDARHLITRLDTVEGASFADVQTAKSIIQTAIER